MQPIKSINIPQPCHEDWLQMTPVAKGRHCQSCCKTVMDFTLMSNTDIIGYIATHSNTCGRISGPKLAAINNQLDIQTRKQFSWKGLVAAASLSVLFPILKAEAQAQPKTEQTPVAPAMLGKIAVAGTARLITIKGVVTAKDDGLPIPGATIAVKGTSIKTIASVNGTYTLEIPANTDTIELSFLGYITSRVKFNPLVSHYKVALDPQIFTENQVVTVGYMVVCKPPFYKRWWYKIKHLF
jgi:hypothetical protein